MTRGAKRYLPSLWYPPAPPFPPLHLRLLHLPLAFPLTLYPALNSLSSSSSFLRSPLLSSPPHLLTMWVPALLLWIVNISYLCSGQDYTGYYETGDMGTEVRHLISPSSVKTCAASFLTDFRPNHWGVSLTSTALKLAFTHRWHIKAALTEWRR